MDVEIYFRRIARNKHKNLPYDEKIKRHRELVEKFKAAIGNRKKVLESKAFGEFDPGSCEDPLGEIKAAIKTADPQAIKQAACTAYATRHFSAVRIAAEFDDDINNLVDFLMTYGELQIAPIKIFVDLVLADPIER